MNLLEVSLFINNISYECNEWIKKIINDSENNLFGLPNDIFNYATIKYLKDCKDNTKIYINKKKNFGLPNICVATYDNNLILSFSGIRGYKDVMCCLNYFLIYDDEFGCYIHKGMLKLFKGIKDEIMLIIDYYKEKNYRIIFTGHSLGASTAKLCCLYFNKIKETNYACITFSCPMVGNQSFGDLFNQYVKNTKNLACPKDFVINIPFNRSCIENNSYMINKDNKIVPYRLTSRIYIWNLIRYNCSTHRLKYYHEKLIINNPDLDVLEPNDLF